MLKGFFIVCISFLTAFIRSNEAHAFGSARPSLPELQTVSFVDVSRYMGTWYEIAAIPQSFQKGCTATTAHYVLEQDGDVSVTNQCRLERPDGKLKVAHGTATVEDTTTYAKLSVSFFWPFSGDYWIIALGEQYEYAMVGHPSRDYLWILSRSPRMSEEKIQDLLIQASLQGYDTQRVLRTLQP